MSRIPALFHSACIVDLTGRPLLPVLPAFAPYFYPRIPASLPIAHRDVPCQPTLAHHHLATDPSGINSPFPLPSLLSLDHTGSVLEWSPGLRAK